MGGTLIQGKPSLSVEVFNIDSRLSQPGELFFAIIDKRDGHDFIADAAARGAAGAVISRDVVPPGKDFALIRVRNTIDALQALARKVLSEYRVKVVGVTGSVGKTTTKEFAAALLSQKFNVLRSEGNFNNRLGVALSLLKLEKRHDVAVLEMAMSGKGEIRTLTEIAPPDVAVITNINPVHLQFLGDLDGVARAKKEILEGTKKGGTAVLNGDDQRVKRIAKAWKGRKIYFGFSPGCDIRARNVRSRGFEGLTFELTLNGKAAEFSFPFLYESFLANLLAAVGVASALSLDLKDISAQIACLKPFAKRGTLISLGKNIRLVDDSYNSNPKALELALKALTDLPARRKVAVLGDMLELGEREKEFHYDAGQQVARLGWDILITVGPLSRHLVEGALRARMSRSKIFSFENAEDAAQGLWPLLKEGDLVLIKGSRGIHTDKIVDALKRRAKDN
jgi:UDP-N-acetylmuramoyl-tripeptide--D-alanyl-D-alanine ligase